MGALCDRFRAPGRLVTAVCATRAEVVHGLVCGADWAAVGPVDVVELRAALIARDRSVEGVRHASAGGESIELGPIRVDGRGSRCSSGATSSV